jgi:hypothetical protein
MNNHVQIIPNTVLDKAITANLDTEGLRRVKAVEQAIAFAMNKSCNEKQLMELTEKIYEFLTKTENK